MRIDKTAIVAMVLQVACSGVSRKPPRGPSLEPLNEGRPPGARVERLATEPFGEGGDLWIRHYRFGNGLELIVLRDLSAPVLSYQTWFRVGSRHEREGKTGLAHLFEHLMFNETTSLARGQFDRVLETAGAQVNAATWTDWTSYVDDVPSSEIDLVVRMEADRMANLVLREPQVESEREVVANERRYRVEDDVEGEMGEILWSTAFTTHPYRWPTLGWMDDIRGFTTRDCADFYRRFYAPNRAVLVVVGDVRETRLIRLIQEHYGEIPRQPDEADRATPEPPQTRERTREIARAITTEKLQLGWRSPALSHPDHAPMTVLAEILLGGRSSRAYRRLVTEEEIARDARGWVSTFGDPGLFEVFVDVRQGHRSEEALRVIEEETANLRAREVEADEIAKARNRVELGMLQGLTTVGGKAEQLGFWQATVGDFRELFRRLDRIRDVGPEDVRRVARRYLRRRSRTVVVARPAPEER